MKVSIFPDKGYPDLLLFTQNRRYFSIYFFTHMCSVDGAFDTDKSNWTRDVIYL